jgi:hypothetical protein
MAIWRNSLGQTASNVAATVVAAELSAGLKLDEVTDRFHALRDETFEYLDALAKTDDEQYESTPAKKSSSKSTTKSRGGSKSKGRSGGGSITLKDALSMEMNSGVFEGETLEDILEIDTDRADDDYGYGDGERDGKDYIRWLAGPTNKNDYTRRRAQLVADDAGIEYDED